MTLGRLISLCSSSGSLSFEEGRNHMSFVNVDPFGMLAAAATLGPLSSHGGKKKQCRGWPR